MKRSAQFEIMVETLSETKEKQVKPKAVKKPKAKSIKKEIVVKKERKPKDKGNDMLLS